MNTLTEKRPLKLTPAELTKKLSHVEEVERLRAGWWRVETDHSTHYVHQGQLILECDCEGFVRTFGCYHIEAVEDFEFEQDLVASFEEFDAGYHTAWVRAEPVVVAVVEDWTPDNTRVFMALQSFRTDDGEEF